MRKNNSKVSQPELSIIGSYLWDFSKQNVPLMFPQYLKRVGTLRTHELWTIVVGGFKVITKHFEVLPRTPEVQGSNLINQQY